MSSLIKASGEITYRRLDHPCITQSQNTEYFFFYFCNLRALKSVNLRNTILPSKIYSGHHVRNIITYPVDMLHDNLIYRNTLSILLTVQTLNTGLDSKWNSLVPLVNLMAFYTGRHRPVQKYQMWARKWVLVKGRKESSPSINNF